MLDFLPADLRRPLKAINLKNLNEIRIRASKPVTVGISGNYRYLSNYGLTDNAETAIKLFPEDIEAIVLKASEYSIYTVNNQISRGYLTVGGGIRIGLAGEYVIENGKVVTIKNITSLNIRIPREVKGCGQTVFDSCLKEGLKNVMIVSRPGMGKTTLLRDLCRLISNTYLSNIMVIDERGEIAPEGAHSFDVGATTDIMRYCDKETAFESAVRSMRPDLIITDELGGENDATAVARSVYSGVKVLASCHLDNAKMLSLREELKDLKNVFDYYVQLSSESIGAVDLIYDGNFNVIYARN